MSTALLDHVNAVPGIGLFDASSAVAVNCCVAPTEVVAVAGATTMLATGCGGVSSASLQAPKVLVPSGAVAAQTFEPLRARDDPIGSVPACDAPMSTDSIPFAGPPTAVNVPRYERNSTTTPPEPTSAMPSGEPF